MIRRIYPQNLRAAASMWLWSLRDFFILCSALLLSALTLVKTGLLLPMAMTICFGFLSIRFDETTIMDYIRWAASYFVASEQYYEWSEKREKN